jgi:hypothetical protein
MDRAKAWIALAGAILTAIWGSDLIIDSPVKGWLSFAIAILTGIATYTVPNATKDTDTESAVDS